MGSKAIYSEVVDLVLNIENYKGSIDKAAADLTSLKAKIEESKTWSLQLATNRYKKSIDEAIALERQLAAAIQQSNKVVQERRDIANKSAAREALGVQGSTRSVPGSNGATTEAGGGRSYTPDERATRAAAAARAYISQTDAMYDASAKKQMDMDAKRASAQMSAVESTREAQARSLALEEVARRKQMDMDASNALNKEQNEKLIADAKRSTRKEEQAATDAMARRQREQDELRTKAQVSAVESTREAQARMVANEEIAHQKRIANIQSVVAGNREIHARMLSNVAVQERQVRLAERHASIVRGTASYSIGNSVAGTRTSDAIGMAAGGSFLLGNTNMGGALYMIERLARHTEIGKKSLGELTEKLFGVKTGADASALAIARFGGALTVAGGAVVALAAPLGAMFAGNKLDNAIASMSTLLADASVNGTRFAGMMDAAASSASRLSESFGLDLVDTVNGFKTALSTGIDAAQLEQFGTTAATVAKGLGTTFEDATSILTTFRDSYQLTISEMTSVSDVLFNAINVGKFQVDDLKNNIGRVVTASAEAGVSFKDMSAGLATLTRVGLSTSQAITSMNRFIQNIVSPTDKAKAAFDRMGLATGHAAFKTHTLMEYLTKLKAAVGSNADLMGELFSTEQGRRGAIGLTTNLRLTNELVGAMDDVGTATIAANRAMDTFSQNFGKIFQSVWNVVQLIGRDLLQVANDVFFAGGPLTADNLVGFKTALEGIGLVVKELGILLINLFNVGTLMFRGLIAGATLLYRVLHGDVSKGVEEFGKTLMNMAEGTMNGFTAMFTTIAVSADRVGANMNGMVPVEEIKKKVDTVTAMSRQMFGEDAIKQVEGYAAKTVSAYQKIADEIRKVQYESAKLEWERNNPQKPPIGTTETWKDSENDKSLRQKRAKGLKLLDSVEYAISQSSGVPRDEFFKSHGALDPASTETKELYDALLKRMERFYEKAGQRSIEAYQKGWAEQRDKSLTEQGFGSMIPKAPSKYKSQLDLDPGTLERYKQLMEYLDAIKNKTKVTATVTGISGHVFGGKHSGASSGSATDTVTRTLTDDELVTKARALYTQLKAEYDKWAHTYTEDQKKYAESTLVVAAEGVKDAEEALHKTKMEQYKKEYKYELEIHKQKMKLIEIEIQERNKLRDNNLDDLKNLVGKMDDAEGAKNPDRTRRDLKDRADTDIKNAWSARDAVSIDTFLDSATNLIDKMVEVARGGAGEDRAKRDAKDMYDQIAKQRREADDKFKKDIARSQQKGAIATNQFQQNVADNPVAQAAIKEATRILNDMAAEAAKRGLSVNGELVSNIEVNVDANIPIGALRSAVEQTVKEQVALLAASLIKGNDTPSATGSTYTPRGTSERSRYDDDFSIGGNASSEP